MVEKFKTYLFVGGSYNGEFSVVKSILLFVPNIAVQYKLKELLEELESYDNFNIHITNSNEFSSKNLIKKIKRDFKSGDKRSLILAVDQLTTGITLDDCDMVALMNDWRSVDKYVQASFRCQSPREGKWNCWVLDFNAARSFELMWEYQNIISKNNEKSLTENISEWVECVNIFNRVDGEMIKVDFDKFNNEYNKAVLEKPRFNYQSVILQDKLGCDNISKALMAIGIKGGSSSSDEDLNDDGIDRGKSKKSEKKSGSKGKVDEGISQAKLMEIAKALVDKTMLLSIFTYFKYDNVDDCFKALEEDNTIVSGIGELEKKMYLETLLLGMNDVDNVNLSVIKFIYDNIYDKEIINKKLYLFNQNVNLIYNSIRENPDIIGIMLNNLMELVDSNLKPSKTEKKMLGEVFTSLKLVEEMLDKLPKEVWSNPNLKWLDPANGIGNFPVIIVKNLMEGLKEWQPDSELRLKHILENMIYVCELQSKNMFIYLQLFDSENKYKLNFHRGSFLDEGFSEVMKEWGVEKFDIVVGNPPYQEKKEGNKKTQAIWHFFVEKSISYLSDNGYLTMVHPSGWRSLDGVYKNIQNILKNNLIYLEMHSENDGEKTFNATTSYDWYCFSKQKIKRTKIKEQNGNIIELSLSNWEFIPSGDFKLFERLITNGDKIEILHSYSAYETRKDWVNRENSIEYMYPCVYTITKNNTINLWYSSTNKNGHFGIPKVIWTNGMASQPTIDIEGKYGLTQFAYAIIDLPENLSKIKKAMDSSKFINLMKLCYMSNGNRFDKKVLSTFKKDFWKEFI